MNNSFIAKAYKEIGDADREIFALMNANRQLQLQIMENERLISLQMQRKHIIENSVGAQMMNLLNGSQPTGSAYSDNGYRTINDIPNSAGQNTYAVAQPYSQVPLAQTAQPAPSYVVAQPVLAGAGAPAPQPVTVRQSVSAPKITRANLLSVCRRGLQDGKNVLIDQVLSSHGYRSVNDIPDAEIGTVYNELVRMI